MKKIIGAIVGALVTTSAQAATEIKSSRMFDIMADNVNQLATGLQSYGISESTSYDYANKFIAQAVFGWDITKGEASDWYVDQEHTNDDSITQAWEDGWTGEGVTIQIYDSFTQGGAVYSTQSFCDPYQTTCLDMTHGEGIAMIIGDIAVESDQIHSNHLNKFSNNADIINLSIGSYAGKKKTDYGFRNKLNKVKKATIVVTSAGNMGGRSDYDRINNAVVKSKHKESALIVGSLNNDNETLANHSNRAASHKWHFVVERGLSEFSNGEQFGGTSSSAARVSAKAALISHKYPNLSSKHVVDLIKFTADDLGSKGVDSVYGYGRVNLSKALSPFGLN